ncbi:MAG: hypothetical protein ACHQ4J_16880, partial [Candidatus Binatia bacterium]
MLDLRKLRRHVLLAGIALLAGCAGAGAPPAASPTPNTGGGGGGQFDLIQSEIFNGNCLNAGCHNSQSRAGNLNLSEGSAYDQLVGHGSFNQAAQQSGYLRVAPGDPQNSFLLIKVTSPGNGQGSVMPIGIPALSQSQLNLIRDWIAAGAPRGSAPTSTPTQAPAPTSTLSLTPMPPDTFTPSLTPTATATIPTPTGTQTTANAQPTPTRTPALNDCCAAASTAGCNDSACEQCVCDGNGASGGGPNFDKGCCDPSGYPGRWDLQCSLEAKGGGHFVSGCNCACASS